ncbi:MAG TPA: lipid II flippase MurJ [Candidatus Paceibacterota bacterium]|nr:lipid II flippase MurJ [Candidatus Paceibacterota bacterium]HRZ34625.1 lipid II flippase MurJ [Candidatus Paceibacterota bacterium]
MVERILRFFNREIKGLHEAAYLLAFFTFFSQILGVIRDRLLAHTFGASEIVDIYYASFRIPDFLFVLVTSFISASVLIPFLSRTILDKSKMKEMIDSLFSIFMIAVLATSVLVFIFIPTILKTFMPLLVKGQYGGDLILFTRILLLSPILLGISQLFGSIVQTYRRFFVYAMSPVVYNLGIIVGIVFFYPVFGTIGLIYGVVVGLLLHVIIQLPSVARNRLIPKLTLKINWPVVREVVLVSLPRAITLGSTQLILFVFVAVAGTLISGSIAIFNFSYNLQAVPLAIIGVSYSMAAFPTLSRLFSDGNHQDFLGHLIAAARHIIFWSTPIIVMFIVLRAQIVRTVLGTGEFDWADTKLTAAALAIFSISALAQSLVLLFVRGYYSAGQTKKPLLINLFSMIITIALTFVFAEIFNSSVGFRHFFESLLRVSSLPGSVVLMLPLAFSVGSIINVVLLWVIFEKDFRGFSLTIWRTLVQTMFASLIAGVVSYVSLQFFAVILDQSRLVGIFLQGFLSGVVGLVVGALILILLRNEEILEVAKSIKNKVWRTRNVLIDQEELSG